MALLAEEIVEEWLNRQGYFTIRGVKLGVDEIDILAVRFGKGGEIECRHVEVQASMRPVSYISKVPNINGVREELTLIYGFVNIRNNCSLTRFLS